ncbi:LmbU family transcriptional regulator [Streptomyces mesophilus]|uniref:LmbU family transcriptional regulator n=1 Tax=Streptomyces mesophilus TaxID=1775132 RepID=UPI001F2C9539|nr:LmbU family transcriptional regulator [Streptomyces mesophilus]
MAHQTEQTAGLAGSMAPALPQPPARQPRATPDAPRRGQVLTTRVGLQIPAKMAYDEWERAGRQLADVLDSSSWWKGDWMVYGKDHYTDRYQRGIRAVGLSYQTLRNYAWVSRRFDHSRRRPALTFQHHAELASMTVPEQELWLDRAEEHRWTTKQLRHAIRAVHQGEQQRSVPPAPSRQLELPGNRIERWHQAARQRGVDFEQWVVSTLDSAAHSTLDEESGEPDADLIEQSARPAAAVHA